jgi:hypothetical protein
MLATYSPEDNKLRIYPTARLDAETYARVKAAGFKWAPRQELFVAPAWTPEREDLACELCGDIDDEDTSLVDRAEDRAERFEEYSDKRGTEAEAARAEVDAIADGIPLGQPILVGHHSERRARKDAERIQNGMRRAVRLWETSQYWLDRAKGAIRHAKYKERPDVRARRIKGLEADQRRQLREKIDAEHFLKAWSAEGPTRERALAIANHPGGGGAVTLPDGSQCWSAWSALHDGKITPEDARDQCITQCGNRIDRATRWLDHLANRLAYERAMMEESGGTAADKVKPEKGGACRCWCSPGHGRGWSYIRKVNKLSVTVEDNWGNCGANFTRTIPFDKLKALMSKADVDAARGASRIHECTTGFYRDEPPEPRAEADQRVHREATEASTQPSAAFDAIRETLRNGIQIVSAPQLFPTPPDLADRVIELADIRAGHTILEPSAGTGALLDALQRKPLDYIGGLSVVEINPRLAEALQAKGYTVRCADFLACNGDLGKFDRIIMNPPFAHGEDIKHIEHARTLLAPGGRLVAICAAGPRQEAALQPACEQWIPLPAGSFHEQGTNVNAAIVVIDAE